MKEIVIADLSMFISKLYVALKEANETKYWLTLLGKADYLTEKEAESMQKDLRVIIGTLVNTIKKNKRNNHRIVDAEELQFFNSSILQFLKVWNWN